MTSCIEICVLPLTGEPLGGSDDSQVFFGYVIGRGTGEALGRLLAMGRLPIVFDLDETLLVAQSCHQLETKLVDVTKRR